VVRRMRFVIDRLIYVLTLWLGVILTAFVIFQLAPNDPARIALGPNASQQQVEAFRTELGLEKSLGERLTRYGKELAQGDFGRSFGDRRPVAPEVLKRIQTTVALALLSTIFTLSYLVACIMAQLREETRLFTSVMNFLLTAMPTMFSGILVILFVSQYYPYSYLTGSWIRIDDWLFLIPAALVLAFYPMGILGIIVEDEIGRVNRLGFVRAAQARGQGPVNVLWRHKVPNIMVPILATFANQLPLLLTSTFVVEIMFSVPGIGTLLLKSVLDRDLPMLQGILIVSASFTLLITLAVEAIYPLIDPRVRQ